MGINQTKSKAKSNSLQDCCSRYEFRLCDKRYIYMYNYFILKHSVEPQV